MTLSRRPQQGEIARRMLNRWLSDSYGSPVFGQPA
jgi:hypothetical protein